jgi:hypothetical protein
MAYAYDKNSAGKNTKASGIELQIVLRASAIDKCILSAQSAFE